MIDWAEYERRKKALPEILDPWIYEKAISRIVKDLEDEERRSLIKS